MRNKNCERPCSTRPEKTTKTLSNALKTTELDRVKFVLIERKAEQIF